MKKIIIGIALLSSISSFALTSSEANNCPDSTEEQQQALAGAMSRVSMLSSEYRDKIHRDGVLTIMKTSVSCEAFTDSMISYVDRVGDALLQVENAVETLYEVQE